MKLLSSQLADILDALSSSGLDLSDFTDWVEKDVNGGGTRYLLKHKSGEHIFVIDALQPSEQSYTVRIKPGHNTPKQSFENVSLGDLTVYAKHWSNSLQRELNASNKIMPRNSDTIKVFISHTSSDADVALALIRVLRSALNLTENEIRCTSVQGYKLDAGADIEADIRFEVNESSVLIGLLTPTSVHRPYVLFELGARWGVEKPLIPLLASGADYELLPEPLKGKNAISASVRSDLQDLLDTLSSQLGKSLAAASSFDRDLEDLVELSKKKRPEAH